MSRQGSGPRSGTAENDPVVSRRHPGALASGCSRDQLVEEVAGQLTVLPDGARVVVACSGGADSTALAYLVAEARADLDLTLAYVGHGLRGADAEAGDRDVVATHASWLGVAFNTTDVEVVTDGRGIEAAARDARYEALRALGTRIDAAAILVGHSADDQAETVVLRLARGTGIDGLAAMATHTDGLLRPLLRLRRADLRRYVAFEGLPTSEDATNDDDAIRRVRVRNDALPALARVGPDPVGALTRLADLARDDAEALDDAAGALPDALRWVGPVAVLDDRVLRTTAVAIARRVVRRALAAFAGTPPSALTVERVLRAPAGSGATLPEGIELLADRRWRTLSAPDATTSTPGVALAVPGSTAWTPAGVRLHAGTPDPAADDDHGAGADAGAQISLALVGAWTPPTPRIDPRAVLPGAHEQRCRVMFAEDVGELQVTAPAPGDRITTPAGTRRLVDIFRDLDVPRGLRAHWPVVRTRGQVAWVPGLAVDAALAAAGRARPALALHVALDVAAWPVRAGERSG